MKSIYKAIVVGFVVMFGMNAMAEMTPIQASQVIGADASSTDVDHECVLLGDRVKVSLSASIVAGFECEELTSAIDIATCHPAGQRAARDIACMQTGEDESGNPIYNLDECTATVDSNGDPITISNAISYIGYVASSTGGAVAPSPLAGNCESATLGALKIFE